MPRTARNEVSGGVHHVTSRGNARQIVFRDSLDRQVFSKLLLQVVQRFAWRCLTYCLMENHYHLLVATAEPTLGPGMQRLNGRYAQHFNRRHGRSGHLWGDRYYSELLQRDAHLLLALRYIALNPVRAGLCARPEDWPWSGHRELAGLEGPTLVDVAGTLDYFAANGGDGREHYRLFVGEGV
jgi:REP element-mobilizing transposase RayT